VYLLVRVLTPVKDMSGLNKHMLEQIDIRTEEIKKLQTDLKDSINIYQKKIGEIDVKISKIKIERTEINNYYTNKEVEIKNADKNKIDSLLRKRYKF
jgi:septal ring factor EnvC (AmiA/AmiB activator)